MYLMKVSLKKKEYENNFIYTTWGGAKDRVRLTIVANQFGRPT